MVVIKSYPGGLSLRLNNDEDYETILDEVSNKFEESRKFFKNASVAISVEGRVLDAEEEKRLICAIEEHSDLSVICLVGKNEETNRKFVKALKMLAKKYGIEVEERELVKALKKIDEMKDEYNNRVFRGNVLASQCVDSEGVLVIIGNVCRGGKVVAGKDIIVMGELEGEALCGQKCENSVAIALKMNPSSLIIGSKTYKPSKSGLFDKRKSEPCVIYDRSGSLVCEVVTPEIIADVTSI